MRRKLLLALSLLAAPSALTAQPSADETAIRGVLASWLAALKAGDADALRRIIPPDYTITVAEGRLLDREQDLEPITSGRLRFSSAAADSVNVRFVGPNAAIVTGIGEFSVIAGDRTITVRERFTDVYEKRAGKWFPVSSHATSLRPKP